jgi:hypothetical protein
MQIETVTVDRQPEVESRDVGQASSMNSERVWEERFKSALSQMSIALEGDEEYHKSLGM